MTSLANGPVLVGTDGSDLADAAVDWAAWEADRRGQSLRLLAEAVAGWADKYPDVTVELRPVQSLDPMATLLDASRQVGLMVVGRHGGNVLSRLVIGSFGDVLVRHAPCPVAIVPGP